MATFISIANSIDGNELGIVETYNWQQFFIVAANANRELISAANSYFTNWDRAVEAVKEASRYPSGSVEFRLCLTMYADNDRT
jgi:hypothetical protein